MTRHHMVNGIKIPFTSEEEISRDAEESVWADGATARAAEEVQRNRRAAYLSESDNLHMEEERGEVAVGTWAAKISEIKARYPKD